MHPIDITKMKVLNVKKIDKQKNVIFYEKINKINVK